MVDSEPILLADAPSRPPSAPVDRADSLGPSRGAAESASRSRPGAASRSARAVHVVGLFRRLAAATIDFALIFPATAILTWLASKIAGVHLPPSNIGLLDLDMWFDYFLRAEPAIIMMVAMLIAVTMIYLLVFQIVLARTVGMRVMGIKIIDWYGDAPSPAQCAVRTLGYLASAATFFLGFLWMGFDSEKRGLHDFIARTYVVKAQG
ncbi:MAG: RDD family protein [Kofleriaceae bacterium]|nr:RDD family protein [Kofleriaceae bacterium]